MNAKHASPDPLHILIVDDEKTAHQLYKLMLKPKGHILYHAENGREAVEAYIANPRTDLILMDIKMPVMDGYQATQEIRKISSDVIILAQTAYALPGDIKRAFQAGCNDHLTKPIERQLLLEKIGHHCRD